MNARTSAREPGTGFASSGAIRTGVGPRYSSPTFCRWRIATQPMGMRSQ